VTRTKAAATAMLKWKYNGSRRGYLQREAAEALGVSTRTIRRMIASCDLLTITVGRRYYISPLSIDRLLFKPSRLAAIVHEIELEALRRNP